MTSKSHYKASAATEDYEPFEMTVVEGSPDTHIHLLREESTSDGVLLVGMWRAGVSTLDYTFTGDESLHVVAGEAEIELSSGETVHLREGDIASFPKGLRSTWRVKSPFKKFFVISG